METNSNNYNVYEVDLTDIGSLLSNNVKSITIDLINSAEYLVEHNLEVTNSYRIKIKNTINIYIDTFIKMDDILSGRLESSLMEWVLENEEYELAQRIQIVKTKAIELSNKTTDGKIESD
jgi:hypothetical protein